MKIGFFDSGLGGITVLNEALKENIKAEYIYLADNKNTPYGIKDKNEVKKYIFQNIEFLVKNGCEIIVIACNTATALCIKELRKKYQWANTQAAYSQGSLMGQLAVKVCYTKGADWVDELVEYIYENVKYMSRYVKENFPKAKMVEPEGTYLVWVDFSGYGFSNEELEHLMLEEAKLWLDSGIIFGPETAQFERFNVACPRVTVEQALTQLKNALDKHLAAK